MNWEATRVTNNTVRSNTVGSLLTKWGQALVARQFDS